MTLHCSLLRASTDFFFSLSNVQCAGTKSDNSNEDSCESGIFHNHCSGNQEPNSYDNSEIAPYCSLVRASTDICCCLFNVNRAGIKCENSNEDSCESGILHNHLSHNNESISRDNTVFTYSKPSNQSAFVFHKTDFLRKTNLKIFFFPEKSILQATKH